MAEGEDESIFESECFIVAPIGDRGSETRDHSDAVLEALIRPAAIRVGLGRCLRADHIDEPGNITDQVIEHITRARLVVADLTGQNPNVFYELAVRHSFGLPVVIVARENERIPFDLVTERVVWLSTNSGPDALLQLAQTVDALERAMRRALELPNRSPVTRVIASSALDAPLRVGDTSEQRLARVEDLIERLLSESDPSVVLRALDDVSQQVQRIQGGIEMERSWSEEEASSRHRAERQDELLTPVLLDALETRSVRLDFQPIIHLPTGTQAGIEVFGRIIAQGDRLRPDVFIPSAERSGLMPRIGTLFLQDLEAVMSGLEYLPRPQPFFISVNAGYSEIHSPLYLASLRALQTTCANKGLDLLIELPESVVTDAHFDADTLDSVVGSVSGISIDDFGTGYSSLPILRRYQVSQLKIDRSLIYDLVHDTAVVQAVLSVADSMGLTVVAEGVETAEQLSTLEALGCTLAQGFYFGRTEPLARLSEMFPSNWRAAD